MPCLRWGYTEISNYVQIPVSVGIAAGWTADVQFPAGKRDFSVPHSVNNGPGTHPRFQWVPGALSSEENRVGVEAEHSPLVPKSVLVELLLNFHTLHHRGVVLN
jgi:hypothetical protein